MQTDMPESGLAAINVVHALAREREFLRSAAINLMRAGLPGDVVADIRELARTRRRERYVVGEYIDSRYVLRVRTGDALISLAISTRAGVVAALEFRPGTSALVCGDWRVEHSGSPDCLSEPARGAALKLLDATRHFSAKWNGWECVTWDIAYLIRGMRIPKSGWRRGRFNVIVACVRDDKVVVVNSDDRTQYIWASCLGSDHE